MWDLFPSLVAPDVLAVQHSFANSYHPKWDKQVPSMKLPRRLTVPLPLAIAEAPTVLSPITTGNFNSFLGGLRINGNDTGNTIWQNTGNLGISANTGNNIIFSIGNGTERMRINDNGVVSINGKQGTTNTALIITNATNATLKLVFQVLKILVLVEIKDII